MWRGRYGGGRVVLYPDPNVLSNDHDDTYSMTSCTEGLGTKLFQCTGM